MKFEAAQQATRKDRHPIRAVNESDTSNSSVERLERQMRSFMNRVESLMSQKADGKKTLKCWTCGREGHLQRSCRARQGAETNKRLPEGGVGKLINDHLVGRKLPDFGKPHIPVCQISTKSTDIADPFILGLDFLKEHGFTLDFNKNELRSIHEEVTIFKIKHRTESIRQVTANENITIPPRTEIIVPGYIGNDVSFNSGLIGSAENKANGLLIASTLVDLSRKTIPKDSYPLPRIDDTLDTLSGHKWFSTLDLKSGYWQVEVHPEDREKTAFTSGQGLWQFKVMPFGLCNAPATFERLMETVLKGLTFEACLIYLDDVIIGGRTFEEHLQNIRKVLSKLSDANLKLNPSKCKFFQKEVNYLGHIISAEGVRTDPEKVSAVKNWKRPENLRELRSFLGLCTYYRKFVKGFSNIARPLHKLTESKQKFQWTKECEDSFLQLKEALTSSPILIYPQPDKPFILDTDASNESVGAVLSQEIDAIERVVAYWSQVARWIQRLNEYYFDIRHRKGSSHGNADALSRRPCPENCRHCSRVETKYDYAIRQITTSTATPPDPWSDEKVREDQMADPDIKLLIEFMESSSNKPSWQDISAYSPTTKQYWALWNSLHLRDGVLYRKFESEDGKTFRWQLVLPRSRIPEVLKELHGSPTGGHFGVMKTFAPSSRAILLG
ncbi:retrovirus-related Pol polyprotein from transposon 297 [Trichonephila clavipes]|nr:retrovirus-related Pol polyprotein from transposon 297 [Trichonephila clavipes]